MTGKSQDESYGEAEVARRRDEVIRRMANTPPQPKATTQNRRPKRKTKAAENCEAGKVRADHER